MTRPSVSTQESSPNRLAQPRPITTVTSAADNPYLRGNFRPVSAELSLDEHALTVTGSLPKALNGRLLRQGPNPAVDPGANHHWFLGHGMIHAIQIEDGRALGYRNRWVRTRVLEHAAGHKAAPAAEPGLGFDIGTSNTNVIGHAGKIYSLGEIGLPYELDADLNTLRESNYAGRLQSNMTAHPKLDPNTGELLFFGYDFGPTNLRYHVADAGGVLVKTVEIPTPRATMIHDFGVTASRVVFMDLPVVFDLNLIEQGYKLPYRWDESHQARVGVMPRSGDVEALIWCDIDPCYVYHPLNAYDDGERIVIDVVRHTRTFDQSAIGPDHASAPALHRWTINPVTRTVSDELVCARGQEFPRVSPNVECHKHRYGYAVEAALGRSLAFGNLLKHDLQTGTTQVHDVGAGRHAGEAIFVPEAADEDAGWLLSVVYDEATDRSDVIVIDAQDFAAKPVATIHLPTRIPYGFHGNWIAAA